MRNALGLLSNLWEEKNLSDVTFKFANKTIEAHTLILASSSPVLAAMFQHGFQENRERVVEIQDIAPNVFESLLRYIYTGGVDFKCVDAAELMVAADKYGIVSLKEDSAQFLSQNITLGNASCYLVLSHLHTLPTLLQSTLDFMSRNAQAICSSNDWMDVIKNYPELSFTAMQRMARI